MDKNTDPFSSIKFKPMSEGLGLNHFADGLPYTPNHAKRKPVVSFDYPPARPPKFTSHMAQAPVGTDSARRMIEQFDAETAAGEPTDQVSSEPASAGFFRRIVAYGLDVIFSTAMFLVIVWASFSLNGYDLGALMTERRGVQIFWPLCLLYLVVHLGYFLIQETTWRRTIGKAIMGIRIRSQSGFATLGRAVCFFIAAVPLGVGLFWYFFDSRRRCWHDVITDSEVILN
ncbi:MAG: RDD family protein [Deltaproteobacteria bacterium]|nr:RDD family protein [Deltaproteobacteria bacterium]